MTEVKVYSTETCPYCKQVKEFLKSKDVKFTELDVGNDEEARHEMIHKTGQLGVPVIDIDGEIVIGPDIERITKLLKLGD